MQLCSIELKLSGESEVTRGLPIVFTERGKRIFPVGEKSHIALAENTEWPDGKPVRHVVEHYDDRTASSRLSPRLRKTGRKPHRDLVLIVTGEDTQGAAASFDFQGFAVDGVRMLAGSEYEGAVAFRLKEDHEVNISLYKNGECMYNWRLYNNAGDLEVH